MRRPTKETLLFLVFYLLAVGGAALWMERDLHTLSGAFLAETARLIGKDVGRTIRATAIEDLVAGDEATRARLVRTAQDVTAHSSVVVSLTVVDAAGRVVASDQLPQGTQLAIPQAIFTGTGDIQLTRPGLRGGEYDLFVPLSRDDILVGYLRMSLRSEPIAHMYRDTERRFVLAASTGLIVIAVVGLLMHTQVVRREKRLARALESALRGESALPEGRKPEKLDRTLALARQFGAELSAVREAQDQTSRRLGAVLATLQGGILVVGANGQVELASPLALDLLGAGSFAELANLWPTIEEQVRDCGGPSAPAGLRRDVELPGPDGRRRLRFETHPLPGDTGDRLLLVRSRESIEALERELGLAIQMRSLARAYAAFAHDLRAPLNAMVMNVELLRQTLAEDAAREAVGPRQQRYTDVLRQELERLNRQLGLFLSHVAPSMGGVQEVNLSELVADVVGLLEPQAKRQHVTLEVRLPDRKLAVTADHDRVKQALLNVVINALEAMPDGGRLTMTLAANDGEAEITIADTGPGIPPDLLPKIYEMHFTTKSGGTGVGLYVARSVVESYGGRLDVEPRDGQGTTFRMRLPRHAA